MACRNVVVILLSHLVQTDLVKSGLSDYSMRIYCKVRKDLGEVKSWGNG